MAWKLIYYHDKFGKPIEGSLESLLGTVKNGLPVRIVLTWPGTQHMAFEPFSVFTLDTGPGGSKPDVFACHSFPKWGISLSNGSSPTNDSSIIMYPNEILTLGCSTSGQTAFRPELDPNNAFDIHRMDMKWYANV